MWVMGIPHGSRLVYDTIMNDPYRLPGPAIISFSGGRTSAYLLRKVMDAYGGVLPDDIIPVFANTGIEHPATYDFVQAVMDQWSVPVHWIEYRREKPLVARVTPEEADRSGQVFENLIDRRKFLPNTLARFCTSEMKVLAIRRYAKKFLGFKEGWTTAIGIRADEPRRVAKIKDHGDEIKVCPLARAGVSISDVTAFWSANDFDLAFPTGDNSAGNCYGCFLKTRRTIESLIERDPERMKWWLRMETKMNAKFRKDLPSYHQMFHNVTIQGQLFTGPGEDISCGACTD
jgi:3'-phosphoadenosine 5'-phosphosulfate sulfotransferase (PAPS reductase)/FAD synthetase